MSLRNLINNLTNELEENNIKFEDIKIKNILEKYLPDNEFYNFVKTNENHYNKNIIFQNNYFEILYFNSLYLLN